MPKLKCEVVKNCTNKVIGMSGHLFKRQMKYYCKSHEPNFKKYPHLNSKDTNDTI